jgi:hypothetical protein
MYPLGAIAAIAGLVVGIIFIVFVVILVLFLLNLYRLLQRVSPENRGMRPGYVFLNLIPIFSLAWMIYTVIKIRESVRNESLSRGWPSPSDSTFGIGLAYAILSIFSTGFSRFRAAGGVIGIAMLVLFIMYWVRTARIKNQLGEPPLYGRPPMTGGPYGQGPGYRPGPGGAGYGAGYGPGPGASGMPAGSQPPASPPVSPTPAAPPSAPEQTAERDHGAGSGRSCSQCGNELDPADEFCRACGQQVPKQ